MLDGRHPSFRRESAMRTTRTRAGWLGLVVVLLGGCTTPRPYPPLVVPASARLVEVRRTGEDGKAGQGILPVSYAPRNLLALSGGGMNGAYTAGLLAGWTASGQRPRFD